MTIKNRIFWRHATAGWGQNDLERPLTDVGHYQAENAANWLKMQGIEFPIYSSEALRTQQTASYYNTPKTLTGLNPDGHFQDVLDALASITDDNAIIVGHLPWIGQIIGKLTQSSTGYISVNTSEVFWLQNNGNEKWRIIEHFGG